MKIIKAVAVLLVLPAFLGEVRADAKPRAWLGVFENDVLIPIACSDAQGQLSNPWTSSQITALKAQSVKNVTSLAEIPGEWTRNCGPFPTKWELYFDDAHHKTVRIVKPRKPAVYDVMGLVISPELSWSGRYYAVAGPASVRSVISPKVDKRNDDEKDIYMEADEAIFIVDGKDYMIRPWGSEGEVGFKLYENLPAGPHEILNSRTN